MPERVLIVDDEKLVRWSLREQMEREGYDVLTCPDGSSARKRLPKDSFDLVLLDLRLPDEKGMSLLRHIHQQTPDLPVIVISAYTTVSLAVEAIREGAYDYMTKPVNADELAIVARRALEASDLHDTLSRRIDAEKRKFGFGSLIHSSPEMTSIVKLMQKIARTPSTTLLLCGESGTGKDLVARIVHYESDRAEHLFMNITCTAIPEALLESELFGHERGAFTDAKTRKRGLFELADGGTIFLDEIGDISPALQAKLLGVLESRTFKRVGGSEQIEVDVRIIAATNRDLEADVESGAFREDLYYRLNVLPITLPPLRARLEEIPLLAEFFLGELGREFRHDVTGFSPQALAMLKRYDWPGNVREVRNVVERALLLTNSSRIREQDILLGRAVNQVGMTAAKSAYDVVLPDEGCQIQEVERELVRQALKRTSGNRTRAAELLGISRDQVRYKIQKHRLQREGVQ